MHTYGICQVCTTHTPYINFSQFPNFSVWLKPIVPLTILSTSNELKILFVFIQQVLPDVLSLCELSLCSSDSFTHTQLEAKV